MKKTERGLSLVEVLVSLAIVAVIVISSSRMIHTTLRGTRDNINKQFATQKAISMLEELRALVQNNTGTTAIVLDDYDDGTTNEYVLTTQRGITDPAAPQSGNRLVPGESWLFERRVTVQRIRGSNDVRLVNVKVFVNDEGGVRLMAEVASVLSTIAQAMPPTQVYDVYLVAIENVPGWWLYMQNIVPFVEGAMSNLQARHPGLEFRKHWVRKLSYGRDTLYTPYVNEAVDSNANINSVYFYPGLLPAGSAVETYYPPNFFNGRVSIDGVVTNGLNPESNPVPYSLADQYNHGMRYPEERALFDARVAAGTEVEDTPTLRLLLDDMYMNPNAYRNAIIINLHGELFPFPPVRNYSDAAKQPDVLPWVRAVTHPGQLTYGNGEGVSLRIYSYHTNPTNPGVVPEWLGRGGAPTPITVILRGISWNPGPGDVWAYTGGVDFNGDGNPDRYVFEEADMTVRPTGAPTGMWWSATPSGSDTIIRLYNSPLKTPFVDDAPCRECGLDPNAQLYGLEYIPSPVEDFVLDQAAVPFSRSLTFSGPVPKNTARWVINIPAGRMPADRRFTVETRLGDDLTAEFPNVSRTYFWRGTDVWLYGDATNNPNLPLTERFQFLGDPRHCPYADIKMPHLGSGRLRQHPLGMGYNRYFDDFHSNAVNAGNSWPGWSYTDAGGDWFGIKNNAADGARNNDGWDTSIGVVPRNHSGMIEVDVPRIFQVLRSALTRTNSVYTTMTGFSYYYLGMGNEIGYDAANGFTNSIPVSTMPFAGVGGTRNEQSITDAQSGGVKYIRENVGGDYWWSMNWLGELAPDSAWAIWAARGNLPTGVGPNSFVRVLRTDIQNRLPAGTQFRYLEPGATFPRDLIATVRRTSEEGSTSFFWADRATRTFHHRYQDGTTGALGAAGTDVANTYNLPMPPTISNNRPFDTDVNDTGMNPNHFLQNAYGTPTSLTSLSEFYRHSTGVFGSSLLAMRDANNASFVVVNGLSPTGTTGVAFISQWSFLSLIQSFLAGGLYSVGGAPHPARVRQLPQIAITSPTDDDDISDPTRINMAWSSSWFRWDGLPYTPTYTAGFADDTTVRFALLYSRDNGATWLYMRDDSPAKVGVRPPAAYLQTTPTFAFDTPEARFPQGNYIIRVEAYRDEVPLHYSYHQYRAFIKRS